ncbi:MAG: hypothetical protein EOS11_19880 [Mesorhizobium sp.]|nr:MAG: hypothetical protein EOS11_19880 [Mesorhizobium sp.]
MAHSQQIKSAIEGNQHMKIAIIGTGYVGLVSGTCPAALPHATEHAHRGQTAGTAHLEMAGGSGGSF